MRIEESKYSIAELLDMFRRQDLVVNADYQRAPRLWPSGARSYFIDTILHGYPFPKVYFFERLNRPTMVPLREIVDGQQRLLTIFDFANDQFRLGKNSLNFAGNSFSELTEEQQIEFMSYTVSVDVVRNAERSEILQMFRRMNAYTLPLNAAEKRHSEFYGEFKNWVDWELDKWGKMLSDWEILSSRQIVRMADAELMTEMVLAFTQGVVSSSPKKLQDIYKNNEEDFDQADELTSKLDSSMQFVLENLSRLRDSNMTKSYVFLSLLTALVHNKWGVPGFAERTQVFPIGRFAVDIESATQALLDLAGAHETKDMSRYPEYVLACTQGANRDAQRATRVRYIANALRNELPAFVR